jgi:hypothetical protein
MDSSMSEYTKTLAPLIDQLPPAVRDFLAAGGWWLVLGVAALLLLLLLGAVVGGLWRALFSRRLAPTPDWERDLTEYLAECPLPVQPPGDHRLTVYHVPVRLRLVVVAPSGKEADVDATAVENLLDRIVPGLGAVAYQDRPRIRVWPPQLSHHGFAVAFHRRMRNPDPEDQPSRWVLVAGKAQVGRQAVLLGLGLWSDEPNMIGRVTLEPHQWLDVIRLKPREF